MDSSHFGPSVKKSDVYDEFGKKIKFILDGGKSKIGLESTIIHLVSKPKILRLGGIEINKLSKVLGLKLKLNDNLKKITYPGQGKIHYSPHIPIRLNIKNPKKGEALILIKKRKKIDKNFFYITKNKNLEEAGKNLYKTLRNIKRKKYKSISVEKIPNKGLGITINDRLKRASNK